MDKVLPTNLIDIADVKISFSLPGYVISSLTSRPCKPACVKGSNSPAIAMRKLISPNFSGPNCLARVILIIRNAPSLSAFSKVRKDRLSRR